jgi:ABC-2 type transport system permease protein
VIAAFAYLLFNTTRNRLQSQLRRLRTPRYAVGFVLGVGYFWLIFGRHVYGRAGGPLGATAGTSMISTFEPVAPALIAIIIAGIWIFGGDMSALAFSEAEVAMLLTAPVPRRGLVIYKLAQSQIIILINVLIWTFLLRRGNSAIPSAASAAAIWTIFTTLNLHRMGAALTSASQVEYRSAGKRLTGAAKLFSIVLIALVMGTLISAPLSQIDAPDGKDPFLFIRTVLKFFETPGVRTALYPFHLVTAPSFAASLNAWAVAMLPALGVVLLHVWWVLRSDAAFEEAAAFASGERAKKLEAMRSRRTMHLEPGEKTGGWTIALASTGLPLIAILWKNAIATRRNVSPGALLRLPILIFGVAAFVGWKSGNMTQIVSVTAFVMAIMMPLLIIQVLRNDLRTDMMNLPLLKSMPLAGGDLVLAEVASGAVAMFVVQIVLFGIAGTALYLRPDTLHHPAIVAGIAFAMPVTLFSLDIAICTILNGSAVIFPGWIRLGAAGSGGVEVMGQAILSMIASVLVFALMILIPTGVSAGIWYALRSWPTLATTIACVFGAAVLGAESYFIMQALGAAFERAEPQQIT